MVKFSERARANGGAAVIITNARVLAKGKIVRGADVSVEDGRIRAVGANLSGGEVIDARGALLAPGFVDLHIHGCAGDDAMDGGDAVARMAEWLPRTGVTAFLPTTMCDSLEKTRRALEGVRRAQAAPKGATVLGAHLEGPFLNTARKGAQPERYVMAPTLDAYARIAEGYEALPRILTIAPEVDGAIELIRLLQDNLVLSAGHTDATCEQVLEAADAGLTQTTHLFNAMSPFSHRAPGAVGAALSDPRIRVQLIADLVHLHPVALKVAWAAKGAARCLLITDAMAATGMPDGDYRLGANIVQVRGGVARLEGGALAGSTLTMDRAVHNMVRVVGVPEVEALRMASEYPCDAIGERERGRIELGMVADLVLLDCDYTPSLTIARGEVVYRAAGF
jgi:N-acetylglucosamine-6-phosphate deacetylase